jgi:hypothetical protein
LSIEEDLLMIPIQSNLIAGTFFGALAGGGLGLGACMFLFDDLPFFVGDTILIGAIACGVLSFFRGLDSLNS